MTATPSDDRWTEIQEFLDKLLDVPPDQRGDLLDSVCGNDVELRREVSAYLRFEKRAADFIEQPLWDLIAGRPPENRIGEQLGPYRLEEPIAEGAMGSVYRASRTDGAFERDVAIKILKRGFDTSAIVRGFRRERQILAGLEHPSIAHLFDGGATEDGLPYLVMEDIRGLPLDQFCALRELDLEQRLTLFLTLCAAVQAAHARLIVHCDLKPSNILVTEAGDLKLLDFGIAKILQSDGDPGTRTLLRRLGTPPYASPEQHRGDPVTTSADVYSLGCILFELLARRPPPRADQRRETDPPVRPSVKLLLAPRHDSRGKRRLQERLSGDLDLIVQKATALDPQYRYSSAFELAEDVRRYLEKRPLRARPESLPYVVGRFLRRNRTPVTLIALLIASLLGGAVGLYDQLAETTVQRDRARSLQELYLELLEVIDPGRSENEAEAVRTALDKLRGVIGQLSPSDRAVVLDRMGRVLYRQEFLAEARNLLLQSLSLRRHDLPWDPEALAASLNNLALVERDLGNEAHALELINETLELQRKHGTLSEAEWLDELNNYALLLENSDGYSQAEELFRNALSGQEKLHGRRSVEVSTALNNLGQYLVRRGRYDEATPYLEESLVLRREILGENHQWTVSTLSNLAVLFDAQGKSDSAVIVMQGLLRLRRKKSGNEHPSTARARASLAFFLLHRRKPGDLEEAEILLRQAIDVYLDHRGSGHTYTLVMQRNLAAVLLARGQIDGARLLLQEALIRSEIAWPSSHWRIADLKSLLGVTLLASGSLGEARPLLEETLPVIVQATGEASRYARDARRRLEDLERMGSTVGNQ